MMLSTISHSMSPSYPPSHDPPPTMTASLAILPQRQPESAPAVKLAQRPKLQINTQQLLSNRTFGKGSTSLRLDTLSAVSPTVRNTFSNAYEAPKHAAAPVPQTQERPSKPRLGLSIDSSFAKAPDSNPPSSITPNSASTLSSVLTSASSTSTESATITIPYKQPHNLASILSNSPARQLIPRKMAPARPLFPAEKRVSFRTPLEEEIRTTKYTLAHSDLESSVSSSSTISSIESSSSSSDSSKASLSVRMTSSSEAASSPAASSPSEKRSTFSSVDSSPRPSGPRAGDKRDSSDSDSDSCPETPVAGRRKRRRDWRWTLGPLPSSSDKSASSTSDTTTSDDSN